MKSNLNGKHTAKAIYVIRVPYEAWSGNFQLEKEVLQENEEYHN